MQAIRTNIVINVEHNKAVCVLYVKRCMAVDLRIITMTSPNGNVSRFTGPFAGNSHVTGESPWQTPVTRSLDDFLSAPDQTFEQTVETPVIWDAIELIIA